MIQLINDFGTIHGSTVLVNITLIFITYFSEMKRL